MHTRRNICALIKGAICSSLKQVYKFNYPGSSVSSTERDINTWLAKEWTPIDRLSVIWKTDLTHKIKRSFFQAAVVSILRYGCTTWTLSKRKSKKLDGNYTRMLRAILNNPGSSTAQSSSCMATDPLSWKLSKLDLSCWRSRDKLISSSKGRTTNENLHTTDQCRLGM